MERGGQTTYNQTIADAICVRLSIGESLTQICKSEGMPPASTVRGWAVDDRGPGFSAQYTRARNIGLDVVAEEVLAIADDGQRDRVTRYTEKGEPYEMLDSEHITRSRLRFDARRWYLSKLAPKVYGDRQQLEHTGRDGAPLTVVIKSTVDEA